MSETSQRRATALAIRLIEEIEAGGPISVADYMQRCLTDPRDGYYTNRSAIGRRGDFTTAPEISQVFGELIGLWAAVAWQQMGRPEKVNLIELGPGRGVLLDDALRAARIVPGFHDAIELHLCEINPGFRASQQDRLAGHGLETTWHDGWPDLPNLPSIVIANEFLDTIAGSQWRRADDGSWREVRVGVHDGTLAFVDVAGMPPDSAKVIAPGRPGMIFTHCDYETLAGNLGTAGRRAPLAGLFIDYGHGETGWGDTLQAVRNHQPEDPLDSPGEADLSLAVDFAALRQSIERAGLSCDGPVTQAEFLGQLGIAERASRLMAANPARAGEIESGVFRLMGTPGMGSRFQAIAVRSADLVPLAGFARHAT